MRCVRLGVATEIAARVRDRLFDLSVFMKELKQRMTIAYNHAHGRKGTLWEERFARAERFAPGSDWEI